MQSGAKLGRLALVLLLGSWVASTADAGGIYRWVDASGNMHFTHDLGRVPPQHRPGAKQKAEEPSASAIIQTYEASPLPARRAPKAETHGSGSSRIHEIRVERTGTSLGVVVRLNDTLDVPFLLDTGASDVVVPLWAAEQLGISLSGPGVRTQRYGTANGVVEDAVFNLDAVSLGTARVENVSASVSRTMKRGLLGLSFFQHFDYQVNPGRGLVTLVDNDLAEEGLIRGGRSEAQWRSQFTVSRKRLRSAEEKVEAVDFSRTRKRREAEGELAKLRSHLEILEGEADDAHVPFSWRD